MSNEIFFIIFVMIPFVIGGIYMIIAQQRFLKRYNEVFQPKSPVSVVDYAKSVNYNYFKIFNFMLSSSSSNKAMLYFKKYKDPKLSKYGKQVRFSFLLIAIIPFLGILIIVLRSI